MGAFKSGASQIEIKRGDNWAFKICVDDEIGHATADGSDRAKVAFIAK